MFLDGALHSKLTLLTCYVWCLQPDKNLRIQTDLLPASFSWILKTLKTNFGDYKLLDALFAETNMVISRYY